MASRWDRTEAPRGEAYDSRFSNLASTGHNVHGEANFVSVFQPRTVLDAGCGTGRVAIELDRRGVSVVGVDLDERMLRTAVAKAPDLRWYQADLAGLVLCDPDGGRELFDVVVAAGNVMIFLEPGTEGEVVRHMAEHLVAGGVLITGFQLLPAGYSLAAFDEHCRRSGLELSERYSTWHHDRFASSSAYVVSVHRRPRRLRGGLSR